MEALYAFMRHTDVFGKSRGWSGDLKLYYEHREFLQPNSNLLHGVAVLNGYAGITPGWTVVLIGGHNRAGFLDQLYALRAGSFSADPSFIPWLEALSVRWLLLPYRVPAPGLEHVGGGRHGDTDHAALRDARRCPI